MDMRTEAGTGPVVPIEAWEAVAGTSRRTVAALVYLADHAGEDGRATVTHRAMATDLGWPLDGRGRSQAVQCSIKALADGGAIHVLERRREDGEYAIEVQVDFARMGVDEHVVGDNSKSIPLRASVEPIRKPAAAQRHSQRSRGRRTAELRTILLLARPTRLRADAPAATHRRRPQAGS